MLHSLSLVCVGFLGLLAQSQTLLMFWCPGLWFYHCVSDGQWHRYYIYVSLTHIYIIWWKLSSSASWEQNSAELEDPHKHFQCSPTSEKTWKSWLRFKWTSSSRCLSCFLLVQMVYYHIKPPSPHYKENNTNVVVDAPDFSRCLTAKQLQFYGPQLVYMFKMMILHFDRVVTLIYYLLQIFLTATSLKWSPP